MRKLTEYSFKTDRSKYVQFFHFGDIALRREFGKKQVRRQYPTKVGVIFHS